MTLRFGPGERERIEAAAATARAAADAAGLAMPGTGDVQAGYRRWLQGRIRAASRRRPRQDEVAADLLSWSRAQGRVELYALCAFAHALVERHGDGALAAVADPALAGAYALREGPAGRSPGAGAGGPPEPAR